jgi:hypothetical protein
MRLNMDSEPINQLRNILLSHSSCDKDLGKLLTTIICKAAVDQFNGMDCSEYFEELFELDCNELGVRKCWAEKTLKCLTDREKVVQYYQTLKKVRK